MAELSAPTHSFQSITGAISYNMARLGNEIMNMKVLLGYTGVVCMIHDSTMMDMFHVRVIGEKLEVQLPIEVTLGVVAMCIAQFSDEDAWKLLKSRYSRIDLLGIESSEIDSLTTYLRSQYDVFKEAVASKRLIDVSQRRYAASSERRANDTADFSAQGTAFIRHIFMSYGTTVAKAIKSSFGKAARTYRQQQAIQRTIQSPYGGFMMQRVDWRWDPARSDASGAATEEQTKEPVISREG